MEFTDENSNTVYLIVCHPNILSLTENLVNSLLIPDKICYILISVIVSNSLSVLDHLLIT